MARYRRSVTARKSSILIMSGLCCLGFAAMSELLIQFTYSQMAMYDSYTSYATDSNRMMQIVACASFVLGICLLLASLHQKRVEKDLAQHIFDLSGTGVPAGKFLANRHSLASGEITGVYVLHNVTNDMNYVGQSTRVLGRVTQHLTGTGNGNVYADYKYGNDFEVHIIPLDGSGCRSLNELERKAIQAYDAYNRGYNRTHGNMG